MQKLLDWIDGWTLSKLRIWFYRLIMKKHLKNFLLYISDLQGIVWALSCDCLQIWEVFESLASYFPAKAFYDPYS